MGVAPRAGKCATTCAKTTTRGAAEKERARLIGRASPSPRHLVEAVVAAEEAAVAERETILEGRASAITRAGQKQAVVAIPAAEQPALLGWTLRRWPWLPLRLR